MPANVGNLPDIDEATAPFSSLFSNNHFDRATVEATVPLADRSIFVASDGRRYLVQSIQDHRDTSAAVDGRMEQNGSGSWRGSALSPTACSPAPAQTQPGLPADYLALNNAATRRRPSPGASASSHRNGSRRPDEETSHAATPRVVMEDVIQGMSNLNIHRFSATPFFPHSDGGVAAAEALTDLDPVPRLPIPPSPAQQPPSLPHPYSSPAIHVPPGYGGSPYTGQQTYTESPYAGHGPNGTDTYQPATSNVGYLPHMDREHYQSMPSLMEHSSTVEHPPPHMNPNMYSQHQLSSYHGAQYPQVASPSFGHYPPSHHDTSHLYSPHHQTEPRRWSEGNTSPYHPESCPSSPAPPPTSRHYSIPAPGSHHFDTQTPVIVIDSLPQLIASTSSSSRSDAASTGRDNVLPGEDVLYDGPVKMTTDLSSLPFRDGSLKVFRNTLSYQLRFHCKVGYDTETYWMNGATAQLIPIYAYDNRFTNVLFIRDNDASKATNPKPGGFYQFARTQELADFQAKLTGEKFVLDISSVRLMRTKKASSRSNESFSSVRVQIWHEENTVRPQQSNVGSFVTAGTALSGPHRNRQVPPSSRLMVFLGRLDEFFTVFVTDDVEVVAEGQAMVKIKARKGRGLKKGVSRWPGVKAHREQKSGSEPAGLDIHGQFIDPDVIASYDLYETFDIEFENSASQVSFIRKWDEVIKERRLQRVKLEKIEDELRQATFSGKMAREIW